MRGLPPAGPDGAGSSRDDNGQSTEGEGGLELESALDRLAGSRGANSMSSGLTVCQPRIIAVIATLFVVCYVLFTAVPFSGGAKHVAVAGQHSHPHTAPGSASTPAPAPALLTAPPLPPRSAPKPTAPADKGAVPAPADPEILLTPLHGEHGQPPVHSERVAFPAGTVVTHMPHAGEPVPDLRAEKAGHAHGHSHTPTQLPPPHADPGQMMQLLEQQHNQKQTQQRDAMAAAVQRSLKSQRHKKQLLFKGKGKNDANKASSTFASATDIATTNAQWLAAAAARAAKRSGKANDNDNGHNPWHVVMGLADGYGVEQLRRFVCSLRATGYSGLIVLGTRRVTRDTKAFLDAAEVLIELYDPNAVWNAADFMLQRFSLYEQWTNRYDVIAADSLAAAAAAAAAAPAAAATTTAATGKQQPQQRYVLATDVRDVVFQRNPFDGVDALGYGRAAAHVFAEAQQWTFRNESVNRQWVAGCVGLPTLTRLEALDAPLVNAGVLFGTPPGVARAARLVHERAEQLTRGRTCDGRDQVTLNVMYHTREFERDAALQALGGVRLHTQGEAGVPVRVIGLAAPLNARDSAAPSVPHAFAKAVGLTGARPSASAAAPAPQAALADEQFRDAVRVSPPLTDARLAAALAAGEVDPGPFVVDDDGHTRSAALHQYDRVFRTMELVGMREGRWTVRSDAGRVVRCVWPGR